jgi:hypothetical protein
MNDDELQEVLEQISKAEEAMEDLDGQVAPCLGCDGYYEADKETVLNALDRIRRLVE